MLSFLTCQWQQHQRTLSPQLPYGRGEHYSKRTYGCLKARFGWVSGCSHWNDDCLSSSPSFMIALEPCVWPLCLQSPLPSQLLLTWYVLGMGGAEGSWLEPMSFWNLQQFTLGSLFFIIFILSTSQLHSKMFFLKTCLLLRYKSTYFSHVVHASVMQYKKITSWWLDVNNSNTKH